MQGRVLIVGLLVVGAGWLAVRPEAAGSIAPPGGVPPAASRRPEPAVLEQPSRHRAAPPSAAAAALDRAAGQALKDEQRELRDVGALPTWDEFYAMAANLRLKPEDYENLLIDRLARELDLTDAQREELDVMVDQEQAEVTRQLLRTYGHSLAVRVQDGSPAAAAFWADLRRQREELRRMNDASYRTKFSEGQMEAIDRHLRNETIRVHVIHEGETTKYLVAGVGR